jgi:hypothetical protein
MVVPGRLGFKRFICQIFYLHTGGKTFYRVLGFFAFFHTERDAEKNIFQYIKKIIDKPIAFVFLIR